MIIPAQFAQQWIDAWNRHDVATLMSFYAENIQLRSPLAKVYAQDGLIRNKKELEVYWTEVLRRLPNLKLKLVATYAGRTALSLHYIDDGGRNVIETMVFDDRDKVIIETACFDRLR